MENRKSERSELFVFFVLLCSKIFAAWANSSGITGSVSDVIAPRRQDAKFGRLFSFLCAFASLRRRSGHALREINPRLVAALPRWALRDEQNVQHTESKSLVNKLAAVKRSV